MYTEQQLNELKKEVRAWLKNQDLTDKKIYSLPIKQFVFFTRQGYKHTLGRTYKNHPEIELKLTPKLFEIITYAMYVGFSKEYKQRLSVRGIHKYIAVVTYDKHTYLIWIKARETQTRIAFYDHGVIKKII